jgi:hypothetical protein
LWNWNCTALAESEFGAPGAVKPSEGTFYFHGGGQALQVFEARVAIAPNGLVAGVTIWMSDKANPRHRGIQFCFSIIFFSWLA